MRTIIVLLMCAAIMGLVSGSAAGEDRWSAEQRQIIDAIAQLSATTAPGGAGANAYGALLADDYSRWTIGSDVLNDKSSWVEGVREWFVDGWRVADRKSTYIEIRVDGSRAFVRRVVTETYQGPDDESSSSTSALSEVWVKRERGWLLQRVDIQPPQNN